MAKVRYPLTEEQINAILNEVPNPPGAGKTAVRTARTQIMNMLRDYLEDPASGILLPPNPEAFEEFKNGTIEAIYLAFIEPGAPVGMLSGTSLSGPLTQMTMNTFHFAGAQSGMSSTFNMVRDFLTGTKTDNNPSMKIFLKDPSTGTDLHDVMHVGSIESIYNMKPELEETTCADLISDMDILDRNDAVARGIIDTINLHSRLRPERFLNWELKFKLSYVLMLQINSYRMYTNKITMSKLARSIEGKDPPDSLTCIWNSQFEGVMYVLVDENRNYGMENIVSQTGAILMFLRQQIIPWFDNKTVKGIRGIASIEAREVNVVDGIDRTQYIVEGARKRNVEISTTDRYVVTKENSN